MKTTSKKLTQRYEAPRLKVHGSIEQITQGASTGSMLDAAFPIGASIDDLTFS